MSLKHFIEAENADTGATALAEVVSMYDKYAIETNDPQLAISCVVHLPNGKFEATPIDDLTVSALH